MLEKVSVDAACGVSGLSVAAGGGMWSSLGEGGGMWSLIVGSIGTMPHEFVVSITAACVGMLSVEAEVVSVVE